MEKLIDIDSLKVTKSNDLIEAGYKLTLNEQRILLMAIARIDSRKPLHKGYYFCISALDFAETFGIEPKHAYEALKDATNRLFEREIRFYDRNNRIRERCRWVFHVKYFDSQGSTELGFSPNVIPRLTLLSKRFTSYELEHVRRLDSSYSIRLYELLKQFAKTGERTITLDVFKQRLDLVDKYNDFRALRRRIIQPAVDEINAYTDIEVEWDTVRKGRKVVGLMFIFSQVKQTKLPL